MRNHASWTIDFGDHAARIRRHLLVHVQLVIGRADERLGEIHRVGHDRRDREEVAVTDPVLGERRLVAARQAVAPQVAFLEVRRS